MTSNIVSTTVAEDSETDSGFVFEPLSRNESGFILMSVPGVCTATFFEFKDEQQRERAIESLYDRMQEIARENPWILGRLVKRQGMERVNLRFPAGDITKERAASLVQVLRREHALANLQGTESIDDIGRTVARNQCIVGSGRSCLNKDEPLTKVTVVDNSRPGKPSLVLLFSMSHVVADGYTYYAVLSMISRRRKVRKLTVKRQDDSVEDAMTEAMGVENYKFCTGPGFLINSVLGVLFRNKGTVHAHDIDQNKVQAIKSNVGTGFVSTNDIITSSFGRTVKPRIMTMSIQWRNKLPDIEPHLAGNYQNALLMDPDTYASPESVRRSVSSFPFKRATAKPTPSFFKSLTCRMAMITNWVFDNFDGDIQLLEDGDEPTPSKLHIPVMDPQFPFDTATVFRSKKDTISVFYFLKKVTIQDLRQAGAPIGNPIEVV